LLLDAEVVSKLASPERALCEVNKRRIIMKATAPALFAMLPVGRALFLPGDVGLSFNLISEGWRRYED
jgi:hypothetical protein